MHQRVGAGIEEALERMTGEREERVTYPQFYSLPGGDPLFVYRDGQSAMGTCCSTGTTCAAATRNAAGA